MARPTLFTSPKFKRLVRDLGIPLPYVLGHLELLWRVAYESGNPKIGDADDVEIAVEWQGERGAFAGALQRCRFIDDEGTTAGAEYHVHDLFDHAPEYVKKRLTREQARRANGTSIEALRRKAGLASGLARLERKLSQEGTSVGHTATHGEQEGANGHTPAPAPKENIKKPPTPLEIHSPSGQKPSGGFSGDLRKGYLLKAEKDMAREKEIRSLFTGTNDPAKVDQAVRNELGYVPSERLKGSWAISRVADRGAPAGQGATNPPGGPCLPTGLPTDRPSGGIPGEINQAGKDEKP